jgi:hypothetical protein
MDRNSTPEPGDHVSIGLWSSYHYLAVVQKTRLESSIRYGGLLGPVLGGRETDYANSNL